MTNAVRVSEDLVREAKIYSKIDKRSVTGQIEHWARIGKCAEENPDLTYSLIKEILIGLAELEAGESSKYTFGQLPMRIIQSRSFERKAKKFTKGEKRKLDEEIRKILDDPSIGSEKKGDLRGVFVHKFKIKTNQYLLAYRYFGENLELIMIGPHENYYRDLKSYLKTR